MKNSLFIFLILTSTIFAQTNTSSLSFYPLQIDNYWEYKHEYRDLLGSSPIWEVTYESKRVIGDTILPNGLVYKIILSTPIPDTAAGYLEFERIDSSTANIYRYFPNNGYINDEYLIDSLRSQIGDTSKASRDFPYGSYDAMTVCLDIYIDTIVGLCKLTKEFENMSQIPSMKYYLSKDIGFTSYSIIEEWQSSGWLIYANIGGTEYGTQVSIENNKSILNEYKLFQNYPNPFNPITTISYELPQISDVTLKIYDITGRLIETIINKKQKPGYYSVRWNASQFSSGVYIYRIQTDGFSAVKKCILMK